MATFEELMTKSRELNAAGDTAGAKRVAEIALKQKRAIVNTKGTDSFISGVDQFGSGLNEGIAQFAGMPVDLMTGAMNSGIWGINTALGTDIHAIEKPFAGSGTFTDIMDPVISDRAPSGIGERFLRRGGKELGFGVPAALTGASLPGAFGTAARGSMPLTESKGMDAARALVSPYMATSMAGDVGAAVAGQTSRELMPDSTTADVIASMVGGGLGSLGASKMTAPTESVQTLDELKAGNAKKWETIKGSTDTLTDSASKRLSPELYDMLVKNRATNPNLFPRANATVDDIASLPPKSLYEVEEARRLAGRNVASNADEAQIGVEMKKTIEGYLNNLTPDDVKGADPEASVALMQDARKGSHQAFKAEAVVNKEMRGETRAATSGSGGNEVNATRQNIRALFDKERDPTLRGAKQGYTPDEMAAMETVVTGTRGSNAARNLGKMAPTSGAFPMMTTGWGGAAGLAAGLSTGNPVVAALMSLPAVAGGVGFAGKAAAESMTKKQIAKLLSTIMNGGKAPAASAGRTSANRAVIEQLLSGAANGQPQ